MVLDLDIRKPYMKNYAQNQEERIRLTELLRVNCKSLLALCQDSGLFPLVESSGNKGLHFWFFSSEPIACKYWRALGGWLINRLKNVPEELSWEVFPKQDKVSADGLGNLVKLPLGTHQKTGRQSLFIDTESFEPYEDQIEILKNVNKLTKKDFEHILGTITIQNCQSGNVKHFEDIEFKPAKNNSVPKYLEEVSENFKIDVKIPLPERNTIEVEQILSGCRPMWEIMQKAKNEHFLTQDEKHAFVYVFASIGEEGKVFVHQVMNQLDDYQPDFKLEMVRKIVVGKLSNYKNWILFKNRHGVIEANDEAFAINQTISLAESAVSVDELMGIEGNGSKIYFEAFRKGLKQNLSFFERNRRPPKDPVNAMLSFGYTILYHKVLAAIEQAGVDPFMANLHS